MTVLSFVIIVFLMLETSNVLMLYFVPGTKKGNGVGVFNAYEKTKNDPELNAFVTYLINWVAGTKLIFIALLLVILFIGDASIKIYSIAALIVSIASFYWRLYPAIKKMDEQGQLTPQGYSRTLGIMIGVFIGVFSVALFLFLVVFNHH